MSQMGEETSDVLPVSQSLTCFVAMPWTSWDASVSVAGA